VTNWKIYQASDAWGDIPEVKWQVEDFLQSGTLTALVGDGATGKTYTCLDLALCVATGEPWLNRNVTQGNVLIVDEESGHTRMLRRLRQTLLGHNLTEKDEAEVYFTTKEGFNCGNSEDVKQLNDLIELLDIKLVIIDSLSAVARGLETKDNGDMRLAFQSIQGLAIEHDISIIMIHHNNRGGTYSGSHAIRDTADNLFKIEKSDNTLTIRADKTRDCPEDQIYVNATMQLTEKTFCLIPASKTVEANKLEKLRSALSENPGLSKTALAEAIGGHRNAACSMIEKAVNLGITENRGSVNRHEYYLTLESELLEGLGHHD
jgi:RecA-family ATPase